MTVQRTLVIGLFGRDADADSALNNLAEAEFAARDISIASSDHARTAALTNTPGTWAALTPEQIATKLQSGGVTQGDAAAYATGIRGGGVFIVVRASGPAVAAAREMLTDQHATLVRSIALADAHT